MRWFERMREATLAARYPPPAAATGVEGSLGDAARVVHGDAIQVRILEAHNRCVRVRVEIAGFEFDSPELWQGDVYRVHSGGLDVAVPLEVSS